MIKIIHIFSLHNFKFCLSVLLYNFAYKDKYSKQLLISEVKIIFDVVKKKKKKKEKQHLLTSMKQKFYQKYRIVGFQQKQLQNLQLESGLKISTLYENKNCFLTKLYQTLDEQKGRGKKN